MIELMGQESFGNCRREHRVEALENRDTFAIEGYCAVCKCK